jgi:hypothetical protein
MSQYENAVNCFLDFVKDIIKNEPEKRMTLTNSKTYFYLKYRKTWVYITPSHITINAQQDFSLDKWYDAMTWMQQRLK